MNKGRNLFCCMAVAFLGFWSSLGIAATPPWPEATYQYMAKKTPVANALRDFATTFGLQLHADDGIPGVLNGNYTTANPTRFLDGLAASHGLTWYYYGGGLYVSKNSDELTRTIHVGNANMSALSASLQKLGLFDNRFGWGEFPEHGTIVISGPPSYVKRVADMLDELSSTPASGQVIRVFRLQHASVDDRTVSYRDQQVSIPGAASVLRRIIEGSKDALADPKPEKAGTARANPTEAAPEKSTEGNALAVNLRSQTAAMIEADPRTNSLVIRGAPETMPLYEAVIRDLDIPNELIEIEAMIVDVNTDKQNELGIDWSLRYGNGRGTLGVGNTATDANPRVVTLGWDNAVDYFLSKIVALETTGNASILARPSVLTSANQPAILDLSETFYIRVQGERVANAIPVSTGTSLRVTPRLVKNGEGRQIQLTVDIEDGQVQSGTVDGLPTVKKTSISTQALIAEKQSLLIGGYFLDSKVRQKQKVPGMGDIPVIGALFSTSTDDIQRRERMFMIVPRIVTLSENAQPPLPEGISLEKTGK